MYSGQVTSNGLYKINGRFTAVSEQVSEGVFKYRSSELSGWVIGSPASAGLSREIMNGESFYAESALTTLVGTVSDKQFVSIAKSVSRSRGTLTIVSGTLYGNFGVYGGDYVLRLSGYGQSFYPASIVATAGGTAIASVTYSNDISFTATNDVTVIAKVRYRSFTIGSPVVSHGTMTFEKIDVTTGLWSVVLVGGSFASNQPVRAVVTTAIGYAFVSVTAKSGTDVLKTATSLDGGKAQFVIGDSDDPSSNVISFELATAAKTAYTNTVTFDSTKGTVTVNGVACTGSFTGYSGDTYAIAVTPSSGYVVSKIERNGSVVSSSSSYTFVHGNSVNAFEIVFEEQADDSVSVASYVGDSTTAYGSDSQSYVAGCRLTTTSHPEQVGQKYKPGVWTFSATLPASQTTWKFMALYILSTDGSFKEKISGEPTGGSISVYIGVDANVVAVFYQQSAEPSDEDQGNAMLTTGAGLKWWEGANTVKTARWKGRRNVFLQPVMFSAAQVYASGYSPSPTVKIHQFQSPNESDASVATSSISFSNQDARRVPVRRREKYVELEIETKTDVTQVGISTSMGAVCRPNT